MVSVSVFDRDGKLVGPVKCPKLVLSDEGWQKRLTSEQYKIARAKGTEPAFCGNLLDNKKEGVYTCVCCGLPLFSSDSKFHSGTGWPSFFQPIAKGNVVEQRDVSHGMLRTEILCGRCDGHLGHVFDDGPQPTGLRFCLNSASLSFTPADKLATLADPAAETLNKTTDASAVIRPVSTAETTATAVFAGGCFWCTEAAFEQLDGVIDVQSGYSGGARTRPPTSRCAAESPDTPSRFGFTTIRSASATTNCCPCFSMPMTPRSLTGKGSTRGRSTVRRSSTPATYKSKRRKPRSSN